MTDVDYIVLDRDGGAKLEACVASIQLQTLAPARVILVDNGSAIPVSERPFAKSSGVIVDRSDTNLGFAAGVNRGFRHVTADYVALVNNDVVLAGDWAASVVAALESDDRCGAAQSVILRPDGNVDGAGIDISDGTFRQAGHGAPLTATPGQPWGVSATAAIYRSSALRAVSDGGEVFDPRFFAYYEDVELSARLTAAGWRMALLPEAKATHAGSASAPMLGRRALALRTRNRHWVNRLHPSVGRLASLLREDAATLVGLVGRGQFANAAVVVEGIVAGRFGKLREK